jgi:hypothetical protein
MARIELTPTNLFVYVEGLDRLWALKSQLETPLEPVVGAKKDTEVARGWWQGVRLPGTELPGMISAGMFYKDGEWVFWDVHHPEHTLVITLADEKYARLIVEGDDPSPVAADINRAVAAKKKT